MESSTVHEPLPEAVQALADDTVSALEVKTALLASARDSLEAQWAQLTLPRRPGPSRPGLPCRFDETNQVGVARYRGVVVEPEFVASETHLRPIERRIRRLVAAGVDPAEVAWRFRRSRRSVLQILALSSRPHRGASPSANPQVLRPLERRILAWREGGASYAEIGARFRRSPKFVRRVEDLARAKLAGVEKDAK